MPTNNNINKEVLKMTKKIKFFISGLMMLISLSSLYGIEFTEYYSTGVAYKTYTGKYQTTFYKKQEHASSFDKMIFAIIPNVYTNNSEIGFEITAYVSKKIKLKTYSFYIGDKEGYAIITNQGKYIGKDDGGYSMIDLNLGTNYAKFIGGYTILNINGKNYRIDNIYLQTPIKTLEREQERELEQKEYEERQYKNSSEYKKKIRKPIIDNLDRNKYEVTNDIFANRLHVWPKSVSGKFDNASINLLNKNQIFMVPGLEISGLSYSYSFIVTVNEKYEQGTGIGYLQGITFSNGEKRVTVRVGNYGVGEVGKTMTLGLMVVSQTVVSLYSLDDIYDIFKSGKTVYVRIHAQGSSYDTQISELERQAFLDLFNVCRLLENAEE